MNACSNTPSSDEQPQPPMYGDILESILSHVPLIHLLPSSLVSKSWNDAVSSSSLLYTSTHTKPWLILHTQSSRYPYPISTHAYDPNSKTWIHIRKLPIAYVATLKSSQNVLYMLSNSKLSFSSDPLHLTWHDILAPKVSRIDPIVAVVGNYIVVAGGCYEFEDDKLAVEVCDIRIGIWTYSDSMPEFFNGCGSLIWLSVASNDRNMFVMEKCSGVMYLFDPVNNVWYGPYELRDERERERVFYSVIGFSNNRLIMFGLLGECEDFESVKIVKVWEVNCDSFECVEIGEMSLDLDLDLDLEREICSIDVVMAGNVAYLYVDSRDEEVIMCEFVDGGGCRWCSVTNEVVKRWSIMDRLVFTSSNVGIADLKRVSKSLKC